MQTMMMPSPFLAFSTTPARPAPLNAPPNQFGNTPAMAFTPTVSAYSAYGNTPAWNANGVVTSSYQHNMLSPSSSPAPSYPASVTGSGFNNRVYRPMVQTTAQSMTSTRSSVTSGATSEPAKPFYYAPPTDSNDLKLETIEYSALQHLIQTRQIKKVHILLEPNAWNKPLTAEIKLVDGSKKKTALPHDKVEDLTQDLERANIPFGYQNKEKKGIQKAGQVAGGIAVEMLAPFALIAGSGLMGMRVYSWFNNRTADNNIKEAVVKAHRNLSTYPHNYQSLRQNYAPSAQRAMDAFLEGTTPALVAKGFPGIGKTHVFLALAKEVAKDSKTMVFEIRQGDVGDRVRALLSDIYSGDKDKAQKAMKFLKEQNGGKPVENILLYADEVENISEEMRPLLTNGVGNPDEGQGLPKLRMLSTCNRWPDFVSDEAVSSRITMMQINPPDAEVVAAIFVQALQREIGTKSLPQNLKQELIPVFSEYEGYSPRTLTQEVVKQVASKIRKQQIPAGQAIQSEQLRAIVTEALSEQPLKNTEIATLIVRQIIRGVMEGRQPLMEKGGRDSLWQKLHEEAKSATQGMSFDVSLNGKLAKQSIARSLKKLSLDYIDDPGNLNRAVKQSAEDLRHNRLMTLRAESSPQLKAEQELLQSFGKFLDRTVRKELAEQKKDSKRPKDPGLQLLQNVQKRLATVKRDSKAGEAIMNAAALFRELREDPDNVEEYLDAGRLDVVFSRVLDFNPAEHTPDNDFNIMPFPKYFSLLRYLREAVVTITQEEHRALS